MGQKTRLLYLNVKPENREWVSDHLSSTGVDFIIRHVPFEGNKEEQIPLGAGIFQMVEAWDLMCIDLPDRKALNDMDVLEYIQSQAGKRFDPRVVENFIVIIKDQY